MFCNKIAIKVFFIFLLFIQLTGCGLSPTSRAKELNKLALQSSRKQNQQAAVKYFFEACQIKGISDSLRTMLLENFANEYCYYKDDSAKYYYSQAAALNNRNSYHWLYCMANYYLLDNRVDSAVPLLIRATERDSKNIQVNNLLGSIYQGDYGNEYIDYEKSLVCNLEYYHAAKTRYATFALAKSYYLLNDVPKSIALFKELYEKYPDYTSATGSLIMIYEELGKKAEADSLLADLKTRDYPRYTKIKGMTIKAGQHGLVWHH